MQTLQRVSDSPPTSPVLYKVLQDLILTLWQCMGNQSICSEHICLNTTIKSQRMMCSADPAQHDKLFHGAPLVSLEADLLSTPLSAGVHTKRQELWDSIWTALFASGTDVAQPPGIRTDAHDFVRDGLHMSRYAYVDGTQITCKALQDQHIYSVSAAACASTVAACKCTSMQYHVLMRTACNVHVNMHQTKERSAPPLPANCPEGLEMHETLKHTYKA